MLPFDQEKHRKINLGGTTLVSSQTDILHGAKLRRAEREETRRRHESALRIQSSWRSLQQYRVTKKHLAEILQDDVLGINGMRALVLIGKDEVLLAQWSEAVISAGDSESSTRSIGYVVPRYRKYRCHFLIYSPFSDFKAPTSLFPRHAYSSSD
jgi:ubiquitin-protein ligase E3 C